MHDSTTRLRDLYVALWNEPDAAAQRAAIEQVFTGDAAHVLQPPEETRRRAAELRVEAAFEARGHDALQERARRAYEEFVAPGRYVFRPLGEPTRLRDLVTFRWQMVATEDESVAAVGREVLLLSGEGRVRLDYQIIEP